MLTTPKMGNLILSHTNTNYIANRDLPYMHFTSDYKETCKKNSKQQETVHKVPVVMKKKKKGSSAKS